MRFAVAALASAGVPAERIYLSMERNMKCGIGLCGHCQFGPDFVCKDGPVLRYDRDRARLQQCGRSDMAATPQAPARGLEVRLLRRLPAVAARLRGRAAGGRRRGRDRQLPRSLARRVSRALTMSRWSKARSPPRTTPNASTRCASSRGCSSPSAPAPRRAASRRCAISPTSRTISRAVYAHPRIHPRRSPPRRRSPTMSRSISSCAAARSTSTSCSSWSRRCWPGAGRRAAHSVCIDCKLQAARSA